MNKTNESRGEIELDEAIKVLDSVELESVLGGAVSPVFDVTTLIRVLPRFPILREVAF